MTKRLIRIVPQMDDMNLLRQRHHLVMREIGEEIDLEIGHGDEDGSFADPLMPVPSQNPNTAEDPEDHKQLLIVSQVPGEEQHDISKLSLMKRKKKVVKKWREEWADTYRWAYVDVNDGITRIFCSICKEYGRKHRRNPYGNEGSRNMQMSALEEHNNSLLHKEALRLQMASKDKSPIPAEKPLYVKRQYSIFYKDIAFSFKKLSLINIFLWVFLKFSCRKAAVP